MAWEAIRLAAAAAVLLAGSFWVTYTAMEAVFGGPAPAPAGVSPSVSLAAPKGHPSPPIPAIPTIRPGGRRVVVPASVAPVSALPVRSRRPAGTVTPSPAPSTLSATESPSPLRPPSPTPSVPSTATTEPPTPTPGGTPTLPGVISGSGP